MSICITEPVARELSETPRASQTPWLESGLHSALGDITIHCGIRLGTLTLTLQALQSLQSGEVLKLTEAFGEPVDVLVNEQVIARGELVHCEEHFGVRVTEVSA